MLNKQLNSTTIKLKTVHFAGFKVVEETEKAGKSQKVLGKKLVDMYT